MMQSSNREGSRGGLIAVIAFLMVLVGGITFVIKGVGSPTPANPVDILPAFEAYNFWVWLGRALFAGTLIYFAVKARRAMSFPRAAGYAMMLLGAGFIAGGVFILDNSLIGAEGWGVVMFLIGAGFVVWTAVRWAHYPSDWPYVLAGLWFFPAGAVLARYLFQFGLSPGDRGLQNLLGQAVFGVRDGIFGALRWFWTQVQNGAVDFWGFLRSEVLPWMLRSPWNAVFALAVALVIGAVVMVFYSRRARRR